MVTETDEAAGDHIETRCYVARVAAIRMGSWTEKSFENFNDDARKSELRGVAR